MKFTFADTQGWTALSNKKDQFHQRALATKNRLLSQHTKFITSNFVLDETYTLLLTRIGHVAAVEFGEMIRHTLSVEVIHVSESIEENAWQIFKRYSDKTFSFTDCTSFVIMQQLGITDVFTNDHNFEQMGFVILLKKMS
jgi:predicted nucleic acid-binding protein